MTLPLNYVPNFEKSSVSNVVRTFRAEENQTLITVTQKAAKIWKVQICIPKRPKQFEKIFNLFLKTFRIDVELGIFQFLWPSQNI